MGRIRPVVLLLAISLSLCTANQRCVDAGKQLQSWTIMLVVVPTLINVGSLECFEPQFVGSDHLDRRHALHCPLHQATESAQRIRNLKVSAASVS